MMCAKVQHYVQLIPRYLRRNAVDTGSSPPADSKDSGWSISRNILFMSRCFQRPDYGDFDLGQTGYAR